MLKVNLGCLCVMYEGKDRVHIHWQEEEERERLGCLKSVKKKCWLFE